MNFNYFTQVAFIHKLQLNKTIKVIYKNIPIVLIGTTNGVNAYEDFCPHRGLALSEGKIKNGKLQCKYHGWQFNCNNGQNSYVPVKNKAIDCNLKSYHTKVAYGIIWLSDMEEAIIPTLFTGKESIMMQGFIKANLINTLENFLEGSHTHFVHNGLIRSKKKQRHEINARLIQSDTGFQVFYDSEPAKGLVTKLLPRRIEKLKSVSTYIHPNIAILEFFNHQEQLVSRFEAIFNEGEHKTEYFARIFIHIGFLTPIIVPLAKLAFSKIIRQDQKILESQEINLSKFKNHKFVSDETDLVGKYLYDWANNIDNDLKKEINFTVFW